MDVIKSIDPGMPGTQRFIDRYGDRLVCVRHRRHPHTGEKITTIEIVVDRRAVNSGNDPMLFTDKPLRGVTETSPQPATPNDATAETETPPDSDGKVLIRIAYNETALRLRVRKAGGKWDAMHRAWALRRKQALALGLEKRILRGERRPPASRDG